MDMIRKVDAFDPNYFEKNKVFVVRNWNLSSRAKVKKPYEEYVGIVSNCTNDMISVAFADQLNKTQMIPVSHVVCGATTLTPMKAVEDI